MQMSRPDRAGMRGRNRTSVEAGERGLEFRKMFGRGFDATQRYRRTIAWDSLAEVNGWSFTPRITAADTDEVEVRFEYVDAPSDLQEALLHGSGGLHDLLRGAGEIVRRVHDAPTAVILGLEECARRDSDLLGGALRALPVSAFQVASGAELELWRLLQADDALVDAVVLPLESSRREVVIHGDLRCDQFLVDSTSTLQLIDGEEVRLGSASQDVGAMVGVVLFTMLQRAVADVRALVSEHDTGGPVASHLAFLDAAERRIHEASDLLGYFFVGYGVDDVARMDRAHLSTVAGVAVLERIFARASFQFAVAGTDRAIAGIARKLILEPDALGFLLREREVV